MDFDEEFLQELCKVEGIEPRDVFEWARGESLPVSMAWVEEAYSNIPDEERGKWASIEEVENNVERESVQQKIRREGIKHVPFRREDERYRHPEIIEEKEKNVVVVNIRDVSGSMREKSANSSSGPLPRWTGTCRGSTTTPSSSTSPTTPTPGRSSATSSSASGAAAAPRSRAHTNLPTSCSRSTPGATGTGTSSRPATRRTPRTTPASA